MGEGHAQIIVRFVPVWSRLKQDVPRAQVPASRVCGSITSRTLDCARSHVL